ncbi:hypothetical protein [Rathayibacter agropyri]|uniref:hypothetical protein n=1 Tax=Rathayibacter agropyri TaxID=1634927 RepID=UPI0015678E4D|nr:hypothetical protein [Rathayibacter agropyri]NRD10057.1 hypothetical protein [Rathayibacter agropyri]
MAISRTAHTALDLIDALRVPGRIDPHLARQVTLSLRHLLEAGAFGPSERLWRRRSRRLRSGFTVRAPKRQVLGRSRTTIRQRP